MKYQEFSPNPIFNTVSQRAFKNDSWNNCLQHPWNIKNSPQTLFLILFRSESPQTLFLILSHMDAWSPPGDGGLEPAGLWCSHLLFSELILFQTYSISGNDSEPRTRGLQAPAQNLVFRSEPLRTTPEVTAFKTYEISRILSKPYF